MKFKEVKKALKKHHLKLINLGGFLGIDFYLMKFNIKNYYLEEHFSDGKIKRIPFTKENIKKLNLKENKKLLYKIEKEKPEKIMKQKLFNDLALNFSGSIISEYTHTQLDSRADFAIFENGKIIVVELKTAEDNLSRLKKQVKDYKKYADKIIVVLNEKHLKNFLKLNLNVNYIVENKDSFELKEFGIENEVKIDASSLIWYKEKENLFRGVKNQSKYPLQYKLRILREKIDMNELGRKVIEERYKSFSDECRLSTMKIFKKKDFIPANKNIFYYYPDLKLEF